MSTPAANVPAKLPGDHFTQGDFIKSVKPGDLVYWLLNIGDGDLQLILLPERADRGRRAIVVDVGQAGKLPPLLDSLKNTLLEPFPDDGQLFPLVVGTHPHDDHISGMPEFLRLWGHAVREYWEPGYWHTTDAYQKTMQFLEDADPHVQHTQPTSGATRFIGRVKIVVLSPAVGLRRRFDTYGVDLNDSSISLRIEFPSSRVEKRDDDTRAYVGSRGKTRSLVLGADSLLNSWAQVLVDFPELHPEGGPLATALQREAGPDALKAEILKVPHHASKHGLSIGLVEAVHPSLSLVSSVGGGGKYNFPHLVTLEALREGLEGTTSGRKKRSLDWKLGIHYTAARDDRGPLGSIAIVIPPTGSRRDIWRFRDEPDEPVDVTNAWRYTPPKR